MSKAFLPGTYVPDAQKITDEKGAQLYDKKGRALWNMPVPSALARHFKSAGARRKYMAGEIDYNDATKTVPCYRGFASSLARVMRATIKYRHRQDLRAQAKYTREQFEKAQAAPAVEQPA